VKKTGGLGVSLRSVFDWISALPICSSAKILLARLHTSNRTLERVKRGEAGPFTFPWELQEIARTFGRANSAVTKCGLNWSPAAQQTTSLVRGQLPVPEFFRETRITHYTKVKSNFTLVKRSTLLERGEEYREERNTYSRACARDNGPLGNKKIRAKAHASKRRMQRLHWDNCQVRFDEAVVLSFAVSALAAGFLESDIITAYDRALHENHGRATDCQAIWDTPDPQSVMPAGCLRKPHGVLIPAELIPKLPTKSGRACSQYPLRSNGKNQTRTPAKEGSYHDLFSNTLAHVRHGLAHSCSPLCRHEQRRLASDAERNVCRSAFQQEQITGLAAYFREPSPRLPVSFKSGVRTCSSPRSESCRTCTTLPARPLPIQRDF
jgi:hypothetical protein